MRLLNKFGKMFHNFIFLSFNVRICTLSGIECNRVHATPTFDQSLKHLFCSFFPAFGVNVYYRGMAFSAFAL